MCRTKHKHHKTDAIIIHMRKTAIKLTLCSLIIGLIGTVFSNGVSWRAANNHFTYGFPLGWIHQWPGVGSFYSFSKLIIDILFWAIVGIFAGLYLTRRSAEKKRLSK